MSTERIESLISRQAIDDFNDLSNQIAKSIQTFEELIKRAAELNKVLGNAKSINEISTSIDKVAKQEAELARTTQKLTEAYGKLTATEQELVSVRKKTNTSQLTAEEKKLASEREKLAKQDTAAKEKKLNEERKKSEDAIRRQNAIITENLGLNVQQGLSLNQVIDAYSRYKISLDAIQAEIRELKKDYDSGQISLDKYKTRLNELKIQEEQQKVIVQNLGTTIRDNAKQYTFATGSAEGLRAKLATLTKAFDGLNRSQRSSTLGTDLKKQIAQVTKELNVLEQSTGRFSRNVGNYGSAFKGLAGSIGAIFGITTALEAGRAIFNVNRSFDELNRSIELVSGSSDEYARNQQFLTKTANDYGLEIEGLSGGFRSFYAAATNAGLSAVQTRNIFDSVSKVAGNLKLSQENVNSVLLAFGQIASKGKVQAEELRGQIGERVPGAFAIAAKAIGVTGQELNKMIEQGQVASTDFLPKFAAELERTFGKEDQIESLTASINRFFNVIKTGVQSSTLTKWLADTIDFLTKSIQGWGIAADAVKKFFSNFNFEGGMIRFDTNINDVLDEVEAGKKALEEGIQGRIRAYENESDRTKQLTALKAQENRVIQVGIGFAKARSESNKKYFQETLAIERQVLAGFRAAESARPGGGTPFKKKSGDSNEKAVRQKFFDDELKAQIEQFKRIANAETFGNSLRINARKEAAAIELQLTEERYKSERENLLVKYNTDLANTKDNATNLQVIEEQLAIDLGLVNKKYAFEKKQIVENREFDIVQIVRESARRQKEIDKEVTATFAEEQKADTEKKMAILQKENEDRIAMIETGRDIELTLLSEKYRSGLISETKYAEERAKIERDTSISILQSQVRFAEAYLATQRALGVDTTKAEAELAAARRALFELKTDKSIDDETESLRKLNKELLAVAEVYGAVTEVVGGFIQARVDAQKNAIQEEIDANDRKTKAEIEAVNASSLSQQEKADRISVLNARNAAQKDQLERRQRLLDQQRARFEKAAGMGAIIINTSIAVTKALAEGGPFAIPKALAIGALGAAQLAVAAATPIPKFKHGTKDAPGGPAIVGDGGKSELIVTPRGELIETPSIPTIMNVPKHSIIFPDAKKITEKSVSNNITNSKVIEYKDVITNITNESTSFVGLESKLDKINSTIKNKKEVHIHRSREGWKTITRNGNDITDYLNRNL